MRGAGAVRRRVALTGQFASVDADLTARENLVLVGRLLGHSWRGARARAGELLAEFGLAEAAGRQVLALSGGHAPPPGHRGKRHRRAGPAVPRRAHHRGDPVSRRHAWQIVRAIGARGATVLLTTQYLDEADRLADQIAVIDNGKIIAEGTSGQLRSSVGIGTVRVRLADPAQRDAARRVLSRELGVPVRPESDAAALAATISAGNGEPAIGARTGRALTALAHSGVAVTGFALGQPSLDEVFLALTGHPAEAGDLPAEARTASGEMAR